MAFGQTILAVFVAFNYHLPFLYGHPQKMATEANGMKLCANSTLVYLRISAYSGFKDVDSTSLGIFVMASSCDAGGVDFWCAASTGSGQSSVCPREKLEQIN